jgi:LemA protein
MVFEFVICCGGLAFILAIMAAFYLFSIYNGLIELRNNIDRAFANIDVLLKQRYDLIPNLVEAVKGYKKYEKGLLENLASIRTSMMAAQTPGDKAKASEALSASLKTVFAVAEGYPELKASENFMQLQKQLTAMENQIADRREFYNNSVLLYNNKIKSLPDMLIANAMSLKEKEYFKATADEQKAVEVKMGKD